jgi:hypothetical protein
MAMAATSPESFQVIAKQPLYRVSDVVQDPEIDRLGLVDREALQVVETLAPREGGGGRPLRGLRSLREGVLSC